MEKESEIRGDSSQRVDTGELDRGRSIAVSEEDLREARGPKEPLYKRRWFLVLAALLLLVLLIIGVRFYLHAISHESTDNAFIDGHIVQISPKVSGNVIKLHITDNQHVNTGDLLLEIDPRDYEARLAQAHANLQAAIARHNSSQINVKLTDVTTGASVMQASSSVDQAKSNVQTSIAQMNTANSRLAQARVQVKTAQANADQSLAQVAAAQAEAVRANADVPRYQQLYEKDEVSRQQLDNALATSRSANAQLEAARKRLAASRTQVAEAMAGEQAAAASLRQAESQVSESQAKVGEARGQLAGANARPQQVAASKSQVNVSNAEVEQAQAAVRQAELDLSYTKLYAPEPGRITKRTVEVGEFLQPGTPLFSIVPDNVWVTANFKETQLTYMKPGQPVKIEVDAYPGHVYAGHVDSIQRGSGAVFSLLPPENATGNYVKVVQRVPVKIVFDEPPDLRYALGPGLSVVPEVRVK
ncbi:MAG: HlyD family secretion protein [Blastocatellia bacterium]|nr:HlyD family secretion protein [Blastocatellia bacterium]